VLNRCFARRIAILEIDNEGIEKHLRGRSEVDPMLPAIPFLLGVVPLELHGNLLVFSIPVKLARRSDDGNCDNERSVKGTLECAALSPGANRC
jgi:hypothetical protein